MLTSNHHHIDHLPPQLGLVIVELPLERQNVVRRANVIFGPLHNLPLPVNRSKRRVCSNIETYTRYHTSQCLGLAFWGVEKTGPRSDEVRYQGTLLVQLRLDWVLFDDTDLANKLSNWQVYADLDLPIAAKFFLQTRLPKKRFCRTLSLASLWKIGKKHSIWQVLTMSLKPPLRSILDTWLLTGETRLWPLKE